LYIFIISACAQWTTYPSQYAVYATQNLAINNVVDCQNYCITNSQCVGLDFNAADNSCWIHTNIDDFTPDNTYYNNLQATQYQLTRSCLTTTTSTGILLLGLFFSNFYCKMSVMQMTNGSPCMFNYDSYHSFINIYRHFLYCFVINLLPDHKLSRTTSTDLPDYNQHGNLSGSQLIEHH
jgi:hypothetical protein